MAVPKWLFSQYCACKVNEQNPLQDSKLKLFVSLHISLIVLPPLYIAWWSVVAHDICSAPIHCMPHTNVGGLCPHQLSKVASVAAETRIVKVVVLYLVVPHVGSLLRCELRPGLVRKVLTHPCSMTRYEH